MIRKIEEFDKVINKLENLADNKQPLQITLSTDTVDLLYRFFDVSKEQQERIAKSEDFGETIKSEEYRELCDFYDAFSNQILFSIFDEVNKDE